MPLAWPSTAQGNWESGALERRRSGRAWEQGWSLAARGEVGQAALPAWQGVVRYTRSIQGCWERPCHPSGAADRDTQEFASQGGSLFSPAR